MGLLLSFFFQVVRVLSPKVYEWRIRVHIFSYYNLLLTEYHAHKLRLFLLLYLCLTFFLCCSFISNKCRFNKKMKISVVLPSQCNINLF